jgi:DNA helicase HerA-like ATPase
MSSIVLGRDGLKKVTVDIDVLLRTRLLVQANSGGGKSWLLRRFAEQAFGKIPLIIVDPEGEFSSLREKFGFVLVGKGGETPADPRSAALLAHKLLELQASAVCDIYELKPQTRHHWVKVFLEALVDAPKKLWRPTIVIVDEAHVYCPEKARARARPSEPRLT